MHRSVAVADLGLGNLRSVVRSLERADARVTVVNEPVDLARSDWVVVPGQGGFRHGAQVLREGWGDALRAHLSAEKPYLGLCLGLQLLFDESEEAPGAAGLGWIAGGVHRFDPDCAELKVPHMGWNQVRGCGRLFEEPEWYYFVHSYYVKPEDEEWVAATATYGPEFCAAVERGNLLATQFHPEKSHSGGHRLLKRFLSGN